MHVAHETAEQSSLGPTVWSVRHRFLFHQDFGSDVTAKACQGGCLFLGRLLG